MKFGEYSLDMHRFRARSMIISWSRTLLKLAENRDGTSAHRFFEALISTQVESGRRRPVVRRAVSEFPERSRLSAARRR